MTSSGEIATQSPFPLLIWPYGTPLNCKTHTSKRTGPDRNLMICHCFSYTLVRWSRECPLTIEVHDRTAIPDPPEFAVAANEDEVGPR
jgi:hypothetical protein